MRVKNPYENKVGTRIDAQYSFETYITAATMDVRLYKITFKAEQFLSRALCTDHNYTSLKLLTVMHCR